MAVNGGFGSGVGGSIENWLYNNLYDGLMYDGAPHLQAPPDGQSEAYFNHLGTLFPGAFGKPAPVTPPSIPDTVLSNAAWLNASAKGYAGPTTNDPRGPYVWNSAWAHQDWQNSLSPADRYLADALPVPIGGHIDALGHRIRNAPTIPMSPNGMPAVTNPGTHTMGYPNGKQPSTNTKWPGGYWTGDWNSHGGQYQPGLGTFVKSTNPPAGWIDGSQGWYPPRGWKPPPPGQRKPSGKRNNSSHTYVPPPDYVGHGNVYMGMSTTSRGWD